MVLEHALLSVRAGEEDSFEAAFAQARSIISGMTGFGRLTLSRCLERPSTYLLLVEWHGARGSQDEPPPLSLTGARALNPGTPSPAAH